MVYVVEEEDEEEDKFKGKFYMVPRSPLIFRNPRDPAQKQKLDSGKGEVGSGRERNAEDILGGFFLLLEMEHMCSVVTSQ